MNHPEQLVAPFHTVFGTTITGTHSMPTIDQYNSFFRGRGLMKSKHFTTTNFFKFLKEEELKGNIRSWYWLFFRLPPVLFSLPPNGGHHSQHMTPALGNTNGKILRQAFREAFQENLSQIPPETILRPARGGLKKLEAYSSKTPLQEINMIGWLTEMYRFKFERYGSPQDKENPGDYDEWQMLKEAFYKELIYPVLQLYGECLGFKELYCSHPEEMFQTEVDACSDLPPFWFDYMIYDKQDKREILPVVCLDLLNWHSEMFARPTQRAKPCSTDFILYNNTAKFRQIKRYLLQGRAKSVLVTDFESALLVRVAYDVAPCWDFNTTGLELLPLAVNFISGLDTEIPLRLAIFCCIEFEYSNLNKVVEKTVVQFTRNRRAFGCWRFFQSPVYQWHNVTDGRYFKELKLQRDLLRPHPLLPLTPLPKKHTEAEPFPPSKTGPMVYPVLLPIIDPVIPNLVMLPSVKPAGPRTGAQKKRKKPSRKKKAAGKN